MSNKPICININSIIYLSDFRLTKILKMNMKIIIQLSIALLLSLTTIAQSKTTFPTSFLGNWKGNLEWIVAGKPTQTFAMQLQINKADSANHYHWKIISGDQQNDVRPYTLKPVDTAKGHWMIDEHNGILLDGYIHGNSFHGAFTVQGSTIVDNYTLENGRLKVEFYNIKLADKNQSGAGTEDSPFVDSYRIGSYQVGFLERVKD